MCTTTVNSLSEHVRETWTMAFNPYSFPELGIFRVDSYRESNATWSAVHTNVHVLLLSMFIAYCVWFHSKNKPHPLVAQQANYIMSTTIVFKSCNFSVMADKNNVFP